MTNKADQKSLQAKACSKVSHLEEQLCFALYRNSQAIIKKYQPYLKELSLTYPQYLVYLALEPKEETTVNALGKDLGLDSGTLSPLLKRMEQAGFVSRNRSAEDERRVMVKLTDRGRFLEQGVAKMQQAVSCSVGLTMDEFQDLLGQLNHMAKTMGAKT
ncbi:MarR family transcriptional regulator [Kiloniella spongiae]|uniref:MarR family transcriptional regulator n=1 Tax=Kiloniella spongiae TaxID=1489064 RepID=A0A0H2MAD5_9PROT|nr:MarR family winged helix-turn-helix transcriptional regulator [Kiloniella spongiae]KLN59141.1 MarR family transcriptional regulator [Kiloniella spongiae]